MFNVQLLLCDVFVTLHQHHSVTFLKNVAQEKWHVKHYMVFVTYYLKKLCEVASVKRGGTGKRVTFSYLRLNIT